MERSAWLSCEHCGLRFGTSAKGSLARFCSSACRQADYRKRRPTHKSR